MRARAFCRRVSRVNRDAAAGRRAPSASTVACTGAARVGSLDTRARRVDVRSRANGGLGAQHVHRLGHGGVVDVSQRRCGHRRPGGGVAARRASPGGRAADDLNAGFKMSISGGTGRAPRARACTCGGNETRSDADRQLHKEVRRLAVAVGRAVLVDVLHATARIDGLGDVGAE